MTVTTPSPERRSGVLLADDVGLLALMGLAELTREVALHPVSDTAPNSDGDGNRPEQVP